MVHFVTLDFGGKRPEIQLVEIQPIEFIRDHPIMKFFNETIKVFI
jgi:hypothetical protein